MAIAAPSRAEPARPHRRTEMGPWRAHRGVGRQFFDPADKANAAARHGADEPLRLAGIADRATRRGDPVGDRGIRHDAAVPDRPQQLVAVDQPFGVLHEIEQDIEDLRLDSDWPRSTEQLTARDIKNVAVERQSDAVSRSIGLRHK